MGVHFFVTKLRSSAGRSCKQCSVILFFHTLYPHAQAKGITNSFLHFSPSIEACSSALTFCPLLPWWRLLISQCGQVKLPNGSRVTREMGWNKWIPWVGDCWDFSVCPEHLKFRSKGCSWVWFLVNVWGKARREVQFKIFCVTPNSLRWCREFV